MPEVADLVEGGEGERKQHGPDSYEAEQQFLRQLFGRGSRHFRMGLDISRARWFEELENWKYLEAKEMPIYVGNDWPYEVTEAGWSELELALRR